MKLSVIFIANISQVACVKNLLRYIKEAPFVAAITA